MSIRYKEQNLGIVRKQMSFLLAFILCIAMFVIKVFSLDCPYNMYITISVIIRVISTAINMSTLARKLFRNDQNPALVSGFSKPCSSLSSVFFLP